MKDHRDYRSDTSRSAHSLRPGRKIQVLAITAVAVFSVTLATAVGQRLPDQAVSVLAGAVCGVGATIPTSLLIVWVMRRRQEQQVPDRSQSGYPPVVVVQPPSAPHTSQYQPDYLPPYISPHGQRQFTVVGGNVEDPER